MINNTALSTVPASCWQLQAEFWATSSCGGERQLADQVTETMQALNLQPLKLERIQKAVLEAVQRVSLRGQRAKPASQVHIRIWAAGECSSGRSWGFFLVERPDSAPQGVLVETKYLVELFLYQENDSQKGRGR